MTLADVAPGFVGGVLGAVLFRVTARAVRAVTDRRRRASAEHGARVAVYALPLPVVTGALSDDPRLYAHLN